MKTLLLTLALLLALAGSAVAQPVTNRPMLGDPDIVPIVRTPAYGIQVNTNGYDLVRRKPILRTDDWMYANGFGALVPEFDQLANEVPDMLNQLDTIYAEREADWAQCYPGVYSISHRKLVVTVEAAPFTHPAYPGVWIAGIIDGNAMRVVNSHVNSTFGFLQHYRNLFQYETNNWMACKLVGCPQTLEQEARWQHPCN